ncbi:MAG: NADH-quinone oxidoreductase subunit L [Acidimicrobiales bacterium]|nr:NADH-quinone oxidoreductase subunit L [Acidimicrobiales bacterium]
MLDVAWLVPALPLAGFIVLLLFGRRMGEPWAGWFATAIIAAAFFVSLVVFAGLVGEPAEERIFTQTLFTWMPVGGFSVDLAFLVDPLSVTWMLLVTGVGALIHMFSIGYMHGDEKFHTFFTYLNLFVLAMLVLVMGDNLVVTFLGWEGVGVCSYLLIAFWFTRDDPPVAGKKAFVTNRIGDAGFMLAIFLVFATIGSVRYLDLNEAAGQMATVTAAAICLLLMVGAIGKSAQIPLFVWLPDAMQGPTPVSALIHAATMVTAGVYLMCRVAPVLAEVPDVGMAIAWIGALTALVGALIATSQQDIKKVLAFCTVSQLGYMFIAVGSAEYVFAVFHVLTHAFMKGALFLGAGSVIVHGMHHDQDMRHMGGLRKYMPITALCFIVAALAISGVPPLAGFWSKDEILLYSWGKSPALYLVGLTAAFFTAYYMSRQVFLVFYGKPRWEGTEEAPEPAVVGAAAGGSAAAPAPDAPAPDVHGEGHGEGHGGGPHESPWVMWVPLAVLAVLAAVGGVLELPFSSATEHLSRWLDPVFESALSSYHPSTAWKWAGPIISAVVAFAGIGTAALIFLKQRVPASKVEPKVLERGFYYDESIAWTVDHPGRASWDFVAWEVDAKGVDGVVNGAGVATLATGRVLRRLQSGYVRGYALGIAVGAALLLGWFVIAGGV